MLSEIRLHLDVLGKRLLTTLSHMFWHRGFDRGVYLVFHLLLLLQGVVIFQLNGDFLGYLLC